jgi:hypothetical protein
VNLCAAFCGVAGACMFDSNLTTVDSILAGDSVHVVNLWAALAFLCCLAVRSSFGAF